MKIIRQVELKHTKAGSYVNNELIVVSNMRTKRGIVHAIRSPLKQVKSVCALLSEQPMMTLGCERCDQNATELCLNSDFPYISHLSHKLTGSIKVRQKLAFAFSRRRVEKSLSAFRPGNA